MVCAEDCSTVFAFDREPVFLLAGADGAVLSDILIEHFKKYSSGPDNHLINTRCLINFGGQTVILQSSSDQLTLL